MWNSTVFSSREINRIKMNQSTLSWARRGIGAEPGLWQSSDDPVTTHPFHTANTSQNAEKSSFMFFPCSFHVSLTLLYWFILSHKVTKQGLQNQGAGKCEAEALGSSSCWFSGALRKEQEHEGTRWHMVTFHFPSHWFNRLISISLGQELKS